MTDQPAPDPDRTQSNPAKSKQNWAPSSSYIDYDLTRIKDSRAGFLIQKGDDPLQSGTASSQHQKGSQKRVIYEHLLGEIHNDEEPPTCEQCQAHGVDMSYYLHFRLSVCPSCIAKYPDQYSLLTKTEIKQDYLLTDEECRDHSQLPCWDRPNPHKSTYANMKLYLRKQVEAFAWRKWGSPEQLDEEYERRNEMKRKRKQVEHDKKVREMRKRTKTGVYLERVQKQTKLTHQHTWIEDDGGVKKCTCGLELEEEEL